MKKIKVFYKNVFYAIKYIYKIDKSYIFLEFLNVILTAFSSIFSVYSLKVLLDVFVQKKINVLRGSFFWAHGKMIKQKILKKRCTNQANT